MELFLVMSTFLDNFARNWIFMTQFYGFEFKVFRHRFQLLEFAEIDFVMAQFFEFRVKKFGPNFGLIFQNFALG